MRYDEPPEFYQDEGEGERQGRTGVGPDAGQYAPGGKSGAAKGAPSPGLAEQAHVTVPAGKPAAAPAAQAAQAPAAAGPAVSLHDVFHAHSRALGDFLTQNPNLTPEQSGSLRAHLAVHPNEHFIRDLGHLGTTGVKVRGEAAQVLKDELSRRQDELGPVVPEPEDARFAWVPNLNKVPEEERAEVQGLLGAFRPIAGVPGGVFLPQGVPDLLRQLGADKVRWRRPTDQEFAAAGQAGQEQHLPKVEPFGAGENKSVGAIRIRSGQVSWQEDWGHAHAHVKNYFGRSFPRDPEKADSGTLIMMQEFAKKWAPGQDVVLSSQFPARKAHEGKQPFGLERLRPLPQQRAEGEDRLKAVAAPVPPPPEEVPHEQASAMIEKVLPSLGAAEQEVIRLGLAGRTIPEIGRQNGMGKDKIKDIRAKFAERMRAAFPEHARAVRERPLSVMLPKERVRTLRRGAGLSVRELAERSGVPFARLRNVESGVNKIQNPDLKAIAGVRGVDPRQLDPGYVEAEPQPAAPSRPTDVSKMALGQRVVHFRETQGLNTRRLGLLAGVSISRLGEVEKGLRRPTGEMLGKIAQALGVGPEILTAPVS